MKLLGFITSCVILASTASAQTVAPERPITVAAHAAVAKLAQAPPTVNSGRDSIKDGTIIGAVAGGVAMGLFGGLLCNALQEPGDPACWRGVLVIGAMGAGIGAAAGAGIDALISERSIGPSRSRPVPPLRGGVALNWRHRF